MRNNQIAALYIAVTIIGFASPPAAAGDGQFEINQACAVNSGCFPGDTPGFPVTISFSGSFLLTGNLDLSALSPDLTAVEVSAPAVTVDLGGFQIVGPGGCTGSGSSISCPLGGLGRGVRAVDPAAIAFTLRNGVVRNMTGFGVSTAESVRAAEAATMATISGSSSGKTRSCRTVLPFETARTASVRTWPRSLNRPWPRATVARDSIWKMPPAW